MKNMCHNQRGFSAPHEEKFVLNFKVLNKALQKSQNTKTINLYDLNKEKKYFALLSQSAHLQMILPVLQAPPL